MYKLEFISRFSILGWIGPAGMCSVLQTHDIYQMYLCVEKGEERKGRRKSRGIDRGCCNGGGDGVSVAEEDEENECTSQ